MNREKILAMEAGRELDDLVARCVMGWCKKLVGYPDSYEENAWSYPAGNYTEWSSFRRSSVDDPEFTPSTDILAALQVMEKMRESEDSWDFAYHLCEVIRVSKIGLTDAVEQLLLGMTPEAICKAALLVNLEKPKENNTSLKLTKR